MNQRDLLGASAVDRCDVRGEFCIRCPLAVTGNPKSALLTDSQSSASNHGNALGLFDTLLRSLQPRSTPFLASLTTRGNIAEETSR